MDFLRRPFVETYLKTQDVDDDLLSDWLASHCDFLHVSQKEYILWVPGECSNTEILLEKKYGENIPFAIKSILLSAIHLQQKEGFVAIVFI